MNDFKFRFVVPGILAGCKFPEERQLVLLAQAGIKTLISLTESAHPLADRAISLGIDPVHIAISDASPPTPAQCAEIGAIVTDRSKQPVCVHCHLGASRTGTVLAVGVAALIYSKSEDDEHVMRLRETVGSTVTARAILNFVKKARPESLPTTRQERFLERLVDGGDAARMFGDSLISKQ